MIIIKKSDVKNHLSARLRDHHYLDKPASQADTTGFSVVELEAIKARQSEFVEDYFAQHAIDGKPMTQGADSPDFNGPQAPAASKGAQS